MQSSGGSGPGVGQIRCSTAAELYFLGTPKSARPCFSVPFQRGQFMASAHDRIPALAAGLAMFVLGLTVASPAQAQAPPAAADVTFTKDIAPILQRSCQTCHRPDGVAPMSLVTYEEVRPWARAIKQRTGLGPRAGLMPPWYIEKNIGIQHYKDDPSLSDVEIAKVAKWADSGAPRGNAADMPKAIDFG